MKNTVGSVLIIGLGMIGSSIALASRSKGMKVYGHDADTSSIKLALKEKIIDESIDNFDEINNKKLEDIVDLIIVSVPPKNTQIVFSQFKELWNTSITITDTSSVKNHIKLDGVNNIVLSHPIAGSHKSEHWLQIKIYFLIKKM